jgi:SAM-dependent methyltransferase
MIEESESRTKIKICPACNVATPHKFLWRKNDCDILICPECSLGLAVADGFDTRRYYTEAYFNGVEADGYADYLGSEAILRSEFRTTVAALRRFVPAGKLVEIGAAYGFFLIEARAYYDVRGIEMSASAATYARESGLDVRSGPVDATGFAAGEVVDAIVMLDVIEHLEDPAGVLQLCADHLWPGGVLLITTGDFQSLVARMTRKHWRLMTPPQHLWYFAPRNIAKMGARFGLVAAAIEHPWKQVPFSLILYQLGRMAGVRVSRDRMIRLSRRSLPVNLLDAMRVTFQKASDPSAPVA